MVDTPKSGTRASLSHRHSSHTSATFAEPSLAAAFFGGPQFCYCKDAYHLRDSSSDWLAVLSSTSSFFTAASRFCSVLIMRTLAAGSNTLALPRRALALFASKTAQLPPS